MTREEAERERNRALEDFFETAVPGHVDERGLCTKVGTDADGKRFASFLYPAPPNSGRRPS